MLDLGDLVWIIPGDKTEHLSLNDGSIIGRSKTIDAKQHIDVLMKLVEELKIEQTDVSLMGIAKTFSELGIMTIVNLGKIDGKNATSLFLPEELTLNQIKTLEDLRPTFEENFNPVINFFKPHVYTTNMSLTYKLKNNCFRDLQIESIILGNKNDNGIELLYQEVLFQKENRPRKNI